MKRLLIATLLLAGCAGTNGDSAGTLQKESDTLTIQIQPAREMYATLRLIVTDRIQYALRLCQEDKIPASACAQLARDVDTMQKLDFEIRRKLTSPPIVMDTEKILRILEISAKLLGAAI
jgi:hypothetical protein